MTITNLSREFKKASYDRHAFQGEVVENDDTSSGAGEKLQRIRIRVPGVFDSVKIDKWLPLAYPQANNNSVNSGQGEGNVNVASLGSQVNLIFRDNSPYFPEWSVSPTTEDVKNEELTQEDYPNVPSSVNRSGSLRQTNTEKDHEVYTHVSGTSYKVDGKGHVNFKVADKKVGPNATSDLPSGMSGEIKGPAVIVVSGNAEIHAGGNAHVFAGKDAKVSAKNNAFVIAGKTLKLAAGKIIQLAAPKIVSTVPITRGGSGAGAATPKSVGNIEARERPKQEINKGINPFNVA